MRNVIVYPCQNRVRRMIVVWRSQSHLDSGDSQRDCRVQDSLDLQKLYMKHKTFYRKKRKDGWMSTAMS